MFKDSLSIAKLELFNNAWIFGDLGEKVLVLFRFLAGILGL